MLTIEFFKRFDPVTEELEERLLLITLQEEGTGPAAQRKKIKLLKEEAGLTTQHAREYLYFIMFEPDEKGVMVCA